MRDLTVRSHRGEYRVIFGRPFEGLEDGLKDGEHLLIDERVAKLYAGPLAKALAGRSVLRIKASEDAKSLERFPDYAVHLIEHGIKRGHTLVAVGGGVVQDITAFLAATLLRGVPWRFYPTTLLAQADSCIGSKSSVNVGPHKNQLGTFTPPEEIRLSVEVLKTLAEPDVRSGIGEMIKVHIIGGLDDARAIARDYPRLQTDPELLAGTLRRSLEIKKGLIELDEFDRKERLVMNYGHTFGHAIESATGYAVPHGIAVTIGLDMANLYSTRLRLLDAALCAELRPMLLANMRGFERTPVSLDLFFAALAKDKKNVTAATARFVLVRRPGYLFLESRPLDEDFRAFCRGYFDTLKAAEAAR